MNKIEQLAREATDLNRPDAESGLVTVACMSIGLWEVVVHVNNEFARHHADDPTFSVPHMHETGRDLDAVLDRMLDRVRAAVAGITAEAVAS